MTRLLALPLFALAACDAPDPLGVRSAEILPEIEAAAPSEAPRVGAVSSAQFPRNVRAQAGGVATGGGCGQQAEAAPTPVVAAAAGGCGQHAEAAPVLAAASGGCGQHAEASPVAAAGGCGQHAQAAAAGAGGCDCGGNCDGSCGNHAGGREVANARPALSGATLTGLGPRGPRQQNLAPTGGSGSCGH